MSDQPQYRKKDRIAGKVIEVPDAPWVDPARTNAQQFKPDREKLNDAAKERYDQLVNMGLENKLSMVTTQKGSNLTMSVKLQSARQDGSTYNQFATVEDNGNRDSVLAFAKKFAEPVSKNEEPLMYASGFNHSNGNNRRFYVHFADTEAENTANRERLKQQREAAGGNTGRATPAASNKSKERDDEIPF